MHQGGRVIWAKVLEADLAKEAVPNLTGVHTRGEHVVGELVMLVAEGTVCMLLETMAHPVFRRPHRPWRASQKKNLTFGGVKARQTSFTPSIVVLPRKNAR
jgi:hypothetical protein